MAVARMLKCVLGVFRLRCGRWEIFVLYGTVSTETLELVPKQSLFLPLLPSLRGSSSRMGKIRHSIRSLTSCCGAAHLPSHAHELDSFLSAVFDGWQWIHWTELSYPIFHPNHFFVCLFVFLFFWFKKPGPNLFMPSVDDSSAVTTVANLLHAR